jgi:hypothetical protein
MTPDCAREAEIVDAIADGRWPVKVGSPAEAGR